MSAPKPHSTRLLCAPVVQRDGRWWLVSRTGTIPATDPAFTQALDRFSMAVAAADRAVAELQIRQEAMSAIEDGGRR
ncbi:hypothetical protein ABH940_003465 [Streptacidiphilus sp. BW17]|uniref:hypothetical protein n=1 Tax=Streptacidiphilus sp. BW17 TaxID=3156274 RepID=UPI0035181190